MSPARQLQNSTLSNEMIITVTGGTQQEMVKLTASPNVGVPTPKPNGLTTLDVFLKTTITSQNPISSFAWDLNGDGTADLTCDGLSGLTASFQQPGLYLPTVTITDSQGNSYTATVIVNVLDFNWMSNTFKTIWTNVRTALTESNIPSAVSNFADGAKYIYEYNYQLLAGHLPEVAQGMTDIVVLKVRDNMAECEMRIIENGSEKAYYVEFIKDNNGIWRLNFY